MQSLHSKLNSLVDPDGPGSNMKSAVMYYGNITKFDPQLHGFDIGTCLEVRIPPFGRNGSLLLVW